MEFLGELTWLHWFIIAGILMVLEVSTGTLYLLFVAAAALIVGLFNVVVDASWQTDLLLFGILSAVSLLVGHYVIKPRLNEQTADGLNEPANALVGKRVRALADFKTGEGRVQLGDSQWRAMTNDNIEAGEELVVVGVEGSTLRVEAFDE